jgi:hypothetical protein
MIAHVPSFTRAALSSSLALVAAVAMGCKDVDEFTTKSGESYCGNVVEGPFVRSGFGPATQMRLRFDAEKQGTSPGTLSTSDGLFTDAPLRAIPQVFHDPLSTLQFGEGRRKNLVYVVDPTERSRGGAVTSVVSLMEGGGAEVRLLRGARADAEASDPSSVQLFGVFPMSRQPGLCGF